MFISQEEKHIFNIITFENKIQVGRFACEHTTTHIIIIVIPNFKQMVLLTSRRLNFIYT